MRLPVRIEELAMGITAPAQGLAAARCSSHRLAHPLSRDGADGKHRATRSVKSN